MYIYYLSRMGSPMGSPLGSPGPGGGIGRPKLNVQHLAGWMPTASHTLAKQRPHLFSLSGFVGCGGGSPRPRPRPRRRTSRRRRSPSWHRRCLPPHPRHLSRKVKVDSIKVFMTVSSLQIRSAHHPAWDRPVSHSRGGEDVRELVWPRVPLPAVLHPPQLQEVLLIPRHQRPQLRGQRREGREQRAPALCHQDQVKCDEQISNVLLSEIYYSIQPREFWSPASDEKWTSANGWRWQNISGNVRWCAI